ncbi:Alkylated DNA repair protein alkB-like protein, partial [Stegodyphus mimosarum]
MAEKDLFKEDFKYYKRKQPQPNLCNVIDFDTDHQKDLFLLNKPFSGVLGKTACELCEKLGLRDHTTWEQYLLKDISGFIFLRNPFLVTGQKMWIQRCLQIYPRKPSITNLDLHYKNIDDIWSMPNNEKTNYLSKLCWVTLGYHHNWDTKVYDPKHKSYFPPCLKELAQHIALCLGFNRYEPEAAILNFYNLKSSLGIHNDHSEDDYDAPILSFSFGQTGIFLIGTQNKVDKPLAMFLKSGDIIVMSGLCRLAYHAVPRIIVEDTSCRYDDSEADEMWSSGREYMKRARINISVRQVYKAKR